MKVLIHENKEKKDIDHLYSALINALDEQGVEYEKVLESDFDKEFVADAIFSFGGDGTILFLAEFSAKNDIPIIGINAGKLGFLTEFEKSEINEAVSLLINNELIIDKRSAIKLETSSGVYVCQNDVFLHRVYSSQYNDKMVHIKVDVDDKPANVFKGDGVIFSTPTGSTAYTLSVGGPILAPTVEAFTITPIAPHSLVQRPMVLSDKSVCKISVLNEGRSEVYADGKSVKTIVFGDHITLSKFEKPILYYRRKTSSFYTKLGQKLKNNATE